MPSGNNDILPNRLKHYGLGDKDLGSLTSYEMKENTAGVLIVLHLHQGVNNSNWFCIGSSIITSKVMTHLIKSQQT